MSSDFYSNDPRIVVVHILQLILSVHCPRPVDIDNMNWHLSPVCDDDEFVAGGVLEYSCAEGFKFDGGGSVRSLVCLNNGSWHTTPAPCTRKYPL